MASLVQPLTLEDFRFTPPVLSDGELANIAKQYFDLEGKHKSLVGERDQNTRITSADGQQFVLKIASADEDPGSIDLQLKALRHLEEVDGSLPVPRVRPGKDGEASVTLKTADGSRHIARVLTYLPGKTYQQIAPLSFDGLRKVGTLVARVSKGLQGFFHPGADHFMHWNIL
ncbi:MAG: phosphotransferase, partial [Gammaproteobacteria bacterium]|nr:phosphotransferase [Gammaproteobacteria bacterium]